MGGIDVTDLSSNESETVDHPSSVFQNSPGLQCNFERTAPILHLISVLFPFYCIASTGSFCPNFPIIWAKSYGITVVCMPKWLPFTAESSSSIRYYTALVENENIHGYNVHDVGTLQYKSLSSYSMKWHRHWGGVHRWTGETVHFDGAAGCLSV